MEDLLDLKINGIPYPMVYVEPGAFRMGTDRNYVDIKFKEGYYIGMYLVTQALWKSIMGNNPSYFKLGNHPVEGVYKDDICKRNGFLEILNAKDEARRLNIQDGLQFKLPSEAQWEYAARGGRESQSFLYAGSNKLKEVGWYRNNSSRQTQPIGLKHPNELGLYDMCGNVDEWCADYWHNRLGDAPSNGDAWYENGDEFQGVRRGGSCEDDDSYGPISDRIRPDTLIHFNIGFRLARY